MTILMGAAMLYLTHRRFDIFFTMRAEVSFFHMTQKEAEEIHEFDGEDIIVQNLTHFLR